MLDELKIELNTKRHIYTRIEAARDQMASI